MKRLLCTVSLTALLLSGCASTAPTSSSPPPTGAAAVSTAIADTQAACVTISPVIQAAAGSTNKQIATVASYANAVCGPLAAGAVPPTVNASTPTWLGSLGGMISALLPIAVKLL